MATPLTATKSVEKILEARGPKGSLRLDLADLKAAAKRANEITRVLGIAATDPRRIRVEIDPYRLPNSSKWRNRLNAGWATIERLDGKWFLVSAGSSTVKTASLGANATDHIYVWAVDDEEALLAARRKAKIPHQSTHIKKD